MKSAFGEQALSLSAQELAPARQRITPDGPEDVPPGSAFQDSRQDRIGIFSRLQRWEFVLRKKRRHASGQSGSAGSAGAMSQRTQVPPVEKELSGELRRRFQPSARHVPV